MKNDAIQFQMYYVHKLSDEMLITTLHKAIHLQLDDDFIEILVNETKRRNLPLSIKKVNTF